MQVNFKANNNRHSKGEAALVKVHSIQSMPTGCYVVGHTEAAMGCPESVSSIDPVLFIAFCEFSDRADIVQCFGVLTSPDRTVNWHISEDIEIYSYGPYRATCELIGQNPLSFLNWYKEQKNYTSEFDIFLTDEPGELSEPVFSE